MRGRSNTIFVFLHLVYVALPDDPSCSHSRANDVILSTVAEEHSVIYMCRSSFIQSFVEGQLDWHYNLANVRSKLLCAALLT